MTGRVGGELRREEEGGTGGQGEGEGKDDKGRSGTNCMRRSSQYKFSYKSFEATHTLAKRGISRTMHVRSHRKRAPDLTPHLEKEDDDAGLEKERGSCGGNPRGIPDGGTGGERGGGEGRGGRGEGVRGRRVGVGGLQVRAG